MTTGILGWGVPPLEILGAGTGEGWGRLIAASSTLTLLPLSTFLRTLQQHMQVSVVFPMGSCGFLKGLDVVVKLAWLEKWFLRSLRFSAGTH